MATALIAGAAFWINSRSGSQARVEQSQELTPSITSDAAIEGAGYLDSDSSPSNDSAGLAEHEISSAGCLSPEQLETHPMFAAEAKRFDSLSANGPAIASYRGLSIADLKSLAIQGDSAAMVVLGAIYTMKARNLSDDNAVPYLLYEDTSLHNYAFKYPLEPDVVKHYEDARDWYYRAALHGRLLALYFVGDAAGQIEGGPVGLGWIKKEDYDDLSSRERSAIQPANVYNVLAYELAPQLREGLLGSFSEIIPRSDRQSAITDSLKNKFDRDREAAKLPKPIIAHVSSPSMEELRSMICASYFDSEE